MQDLQELRSKYKRYLSFYSQEPDNHDILCQLVDLETQLGAFDEAREHLRSGLAIWHQDPALEFRQATIELAAGQPVTAAEILERMLDAGIDQPAIRYNLGYAWLSIGLARRAKEMFDSLSGHESDIPELLLMQSRAQHHLGDLSAATEHVERYLKAYPESSEALGILALLHLDSENFREAKSYALKALELDPNSSEALVTLGSLALDQLNAVEAESLFQQVINSHPQSGRAWSGIGLTYMMKQDLEHAESALINAVKYMPKHIGTWQALAWCQIGKRDLKAAEESFNSANEIDRNFGETHGGLAVVAALRGDRDGADRLAKVALRLDSESFSARFAQSLMLKRENPVAAQALIENMLTTSMTDSGQNLQSMVLTVFRKNSSVKQQ